MLSALTRLIETHDIHFQLVFSQATDIVGPGGHKILNPNLSEEVLEGFRVKQGKHVLEIEEIGHLGLGNLVDPEQLGVQHVVILDLGEFYWKE